MEDEFIEQTEAEITKEFDMYTEEGLEMYGDDDAISPYEQAFMRGYLDDNNSTDEVV